MIINENSGDPRLVAEAAMLLVIDVQTRLVPAMADAEATVRNVRLLLEGAALFGLPTAISEQYPEGLGATVPELMAVAGHASLIEKRSFALGDDHSAILFNAWLARRPDATILVAGIETHVCVWQTVALLLAKGRRIAVAADAVTSRTNANREAALARMERAGATILTTEMALFELCRSSAAPTFKAVSRLVR